jgi:tripartite-type tricarboxylate transporter receptor subunit TctC
MKIKWRTAKLVAAYIAVLGVGHAAQPSTRAQPSDAAYPGKPVRVIVPNVPGGGPDLVGRALSPALSELLGQQFVVDNRPGAAGRIAVELAARADSDGHTILLGIVNKLHAAVAGVVQRPDVREIFARSLVPIAVSRSPEEFQGYVRDEIRRWERIIRENNIKLE